jgi:hypothetical protein
LGWRRWLLDHLSFDTRFLTVAFLDEVDTGDAGSDHAGCGAGGNGGCADPGGGLAGGARDTDGGLATTRGEDPGGDVAGSVEDSEGARAN